VQDQARTARAAADSTDASALEGVAQSSWPSALSAPLQNGPVRLPAPPPRPAGQRISGWKAAAGLAFRDPGGAPEVLVGWLRAGGDAKLQERF
jgi:hypothetical protein